MDPDHLLRPARRHRQLHDRDGGRVGSEDRAGLGDDLVQRAEDGDLGLLRLEDRLDHELPIAKVADVGREPDRLEGPVALLLRKLAAPQGAGERRIDSAPPAIEGVVVHLAHDHVEPGPGADLGDARAHQPAAHDADPFDAHAQSVGSLP